jgi:hypothetical protein
MLYLCHNRMRLLKSQEHSNKKNCPNKLCSPSNLGLQKKSKLTKWSCLVSPLPDRRNSHLNFIYVRRPYKDWWYRRIHIRPAKNWLTNSQNDPNESHLHLIRENSASLFNSIIHPNKGWLQELRASMLCLVNTSHLFVPIVLFISFYWTRNKMKQK